MMNSLLNFNYRTAYWLEKVSLLLGLALVFFTVQSTAKGQCAADGGAIALADGTVATSICIDDTGDPLDVTTDGNGMGTNRQFVITDDVGNILALPDNDGPFDLNGAGPGTCEIWYLAYEDGLMNLEVDNNLSELAGCFDLSNEITVERQAPDGGMVTLAGGETTAYACAGDVMVDVAHTTSATALSYWYVITDDNDNILDFANSTETSTLDLSAAPVGTCRIWGWSTRGLPAPVMGEPISSLAPPGGCAALSEAFVTVIRQTTAVAGTIMLASGSVDTSICIDGNGDPLAVIRDDNAIGVNRQFVITDDVGNILALPDNEGPFDLNGAGPGTCELWYLAYENGLQGLMTGNNVADFQGCYDLSNPITVVRQAPDGGTVTLSGGSTDTTAAAGDVMVDVVHTTTATELDYWYVITDDSNNILGFANSAETSTLDLSSAPAGTCRIWGWSYRGLAGPVMGEPLSSLAPDGGCAAISEDFVTVVREDGGSGFTFETVVINEFGNNGQIEILNGTDEAIDISDYWLCDFPNYQQLSALTLECGDLMLGPGEVVVVSDFAFDVTGAELGLYTSRSFESSDAIISYVQWGMAGGGRSAVAVGAGIWAEGFLAPTPTDNQSTQTFVRDDSLSWSLAGPSFCELNDATSTDLIDLGASISLFPNPVADLLSVDVSGLNSDRTTFQVFDSHGRKVIERIAGFGNGRTTIDLSDVATGAYLLRILNGSGFATRRVIVR